MPRLLATLAAALFCALATPASAERGTAGGAGTLTIGITQFPATFHPTIDAMLAKSYMLALGRRPITAYDPDWRQICMLCSKLPTIENGLAEKEELPDGSEGIAVTYSLHPDATWGDGEPVTSEDVRFTWEVGKHPKSGVAAGEIYRRIREIEIHDEHTFTVHVDRVTFDYNDFALSILPAHLEREVFEADPAQYRNRTTFDAEPTNPGLYFGPYRMVEVTQGARAVFEPNPTWYGPAPAFDRIVVRVIENTAALEANLLSGSIDMIAGELGLNIDQALALEKRHGERYEFIYQPGLVYEHIDFNLDNSILAERKIRHALAYAADRQAITEQLFHGKQQVAHSSVSPLDTVHTEDVPKYPYKPDKAAKLLDEAGWNRMKGGIRHNAKGEPLRLRLMTTAGNRTRELVQQVLQSQWRQAGIDVRIKNEPARVFFGETVTKRKYGGMAMYAWLSSPESVPRSSLHSDMIPSEENAWSGQNIPGFANERMDALIDRTERELDPEKRKKLWAEIQQLYARELPVLPLFWRAQPFVLPTWLTGLEPTGHQFPTTLWVEEWGRKAGG